MRTSRFFWLLVPIALLAACHDARPVDAGPDARRYHGEGFEGIVVLVTPRLAPGMFGNGEEAYWTPDDATIARFEAGLAAHLRASPPRDSPKLHEKYRPYHRRYVGAQIHGARKLDVSFYCPSAPDWDQPFLAVEDGGDCYFQVVYDVATGVYERVSINGSG